ncbi:MAG: glutathione S-transferase family protein [Anaerolineae bacterium]
MTQPFTLHFTPHTCSLASHIVLKEVNADYTLNRIDFRQKQQLSPDYLRINPKGRVPALETPQGVLTETPAMLVYIAQMHPEANLVPFEDPFAFAAIQAFNSYLCSTVHVAHAHRMRGTRWADDPDAIAAMQKKVPESVGACFDYIEETYLRGPWVMGGRYTIADPYLFTLAQWLEGDGVNLDRIPRVVDHRTRMLQRQTVQDAIAAELA